MSSERDPYQTPSPYPLGWQFPTGQHPTLPGPGPAGVPGQPVDQAKAPPMSTTSTAAPAMSNAMMAAEPAQAEVISPPTSGRPGVAGFWTHPATVVGAAGVVLLLVTTLAIVTLRSTVGGTHTTGSGRLPGGAGGTVPISGSPGVRTPVGSNPGGGPTIGGPIGGPGAGAGSGRGPQSGGNGSQTGQQPSGAGPSPTAVTPLVTYQELRSGKLSLKDAEQADLDTGTTNAETTLGGRPDMVLRKAVIRAKGAAAFSIWTGSGGPTPQACTAATGWFIELTANQVADNLVLCVRTSDNRPAAITFLAVGKSANGKLLTITISYTVWDKS